MGCTHLCLAGILTTMSPPAATQEMPWTIGRLLQWTQPYLAERGVPEARLAAEVDRRMRELSEQSGLEDPGKLAILVALNLADELSRCEQSAAGERGEIESRVSELSERLVEALGR